MGSVPGFQDGARDPLTVQNQVSDRSTTRTRSSSQYSNTKDSIVYAFPVVQLPTTAPTDSPSTSVSDTPLMENMMTGWAL